MPWFDTDNTVESTKGPKCPYCGFEHDDSEDYQHHVSIWGSDGERKEQTCHGCDLTFKVIEHVARTWYSEPTVQAVAK